jgi:hypothetical protein
VEVIALGYTLAKIHRASQTTSLEHSLLLPGRLRKGFAIIDVRIRLALQIYCPILIECGVLREWLGGFTAESQGVGRRDMSNPLFSTAI